MLLQDSIALLHESRFFIFIILGSMEILHYKVTFFLILYLR
jgi:hypothetical protein